MNNDLPWGRRWVHYPAPQRFLFLIRGLTFFCCEPSSYGWAISPDLETFVLNIIQWGQRSWEVTLVRERKLSQQRRECSLNRIKQKLSGSPRLDMHVVSCCIITTTGHWATMSILSVSLQDPSAIPRCHPPLKPGRLFWRIWSCQVETTEDMGTGDSQTAHWVHLTMTLNINKPLSLTPFIGSLPNVYLLYLLSSLIVNTVRMDVWMVLSDREVWLWAGLKSWCYGVTLLSI